MVDLEQIPNSNIIIITARGKITDDDYEDIIVPAIESTLKTYDNALSLYPRRGVR